MRISISLLYNLSMPDYLVSRRILKEAVAQTGAAWAAFLFRQDVGFDVGASSGLAKQPLQRLIQYLKDKDFFDWLVTTVEKNRPGEKDAPGMGIPGRALHAFPLGTLQAVLLVGQDGPLPVVAHDFWIFVAHAVEDLTGDSEGRTRHLQEVVVELQETQQELRARIAAQHDAEMRLVQAAKLAAVGEMSAGVAHELNNPLTTVVGFTELALDTLPSDSPLYADLDLVLREAKRARSVVRRLLDFSRQSESARNRASLNELVEDVVALTKHLMHTNQVQPAVTLDASLPWVVMDRNQIKQVILNLVQNALYAMPRGGQLQIRTFASERYGRDWAIVQVVDSGVGIPPENLPKIFEPFFTTRGTQGGTGLGLSVTYGIVTDHGGMIEVESQPEQGATFTVWLPLEREHVAA